ncbi:Putative hydrolase of the HD superfamily [Sorangium cellulosum So ce56]|uniref:Hydrolase of the HD superfamily n=1 Tax=Sorangium cellulosum (strain So ce56) TaxID=448385 RepID=A9G7D7_SORC5|nr:type III-B CRISPR-associated protein Cas10/Cmr2 [Sorangium cellulosum]CAN95843.1 Putative hydrolase of the HD superfamily [Sorangium cellulosum So ce56]
MSERDRDRDRNLAVAHPVHGRTGDDEIEHHGTEADRTRFWQQKLLQLLHDPPGKAFFLRQGAGGHKAVAADLFQATAGVPLKYVRPGPDWAASGADRPVSSPPRPAHVSVDWVKNPILTHPLASGTAAIDLGRRDLPASREQVRALAGDVGRTLRELLERRVSQEDELDDLPEEEERERFLSERAEQVESELAALPRWHDDARLQQACLQLWRRLPEEPPPGVAEVVWRHQPADSRAPDHSLWDHLRVTSSLSFLSGRRREGPVMPWLLAFSLGPVQRFIAQSRTSTDLWTSSMLLSDLVWHAMVPFVERYGPEAIVYPDLRANPRADVWLWEQANGADGAAPPAHAARYQDVLPEQLNPCSYAGIFPNTFIALVPLGGERYLTLLKDLAGEARRAVLGRWRQLADLARRYFLEQAAKRPEAMSDSERKAFEATWARQHEDVLFTSWSAAAWPSIERVNDPESLAIREALVAQRPAQALPREDAEALAAWRERHTTWIPGETFARYAEARYVYARTNRTVHQCERGFDYPLLHHALVSRHGLRKAEAQGAAIAEESGEKCTLCGLRQALGAGDAGASVDAQRETARAFWRRFDRNSDDGAERLCAVCTMKRVLVRAGVATDERGARRRVGLTAAWAGPATPLDDVCDRDELRVPFPSTATIAAQGYLCAVATRRELQAQVAEVVRCCEDARLPRTSFVRSLRSLAEAAQRADGAGLRFLEYEAELTVFPEVLAAAEERAPEGGGREQGDGAAQRGGLRDRDGKRVPRSKVEALRRAVESLRRAAKELDRPAGSARRAGDRIPAPGSQVALIALDGDRISQILLGEKIGARWRDVIHPEAVATMESNEVTRAARWPELLGRKRLMGPSTHAFVNRVLAEFAHTIVPWVVEREFSGRLIYAGGDDVLAIAPAGEALDLCARLAQLYSAAWVLDTSPGEGPWAWRAKTWTSSTSIRASERFVVVAPSETGEPLPWPIPEASRRGPIPAGDAAAASAAESAEERLLPMMGAGQTLSAGIAIGHYKTSLGGLVKAAWDERDRVKGEDEERDCAKEDNEERIRVKGDDEERDRATREDLAVKNAFSIRRYTRGGEKARLRLSWGRRCAAPGKALAGYLRVKAVIEGFKTGALPGRLPYKLREVEGAVLAAWLVEAKALPGGLTSREARRELVKRVEPFARGLFGAQCAAEVEGAFEIWWQGLLSALRAHERRWRAPDAVPPGATPVDDGAPSRGLGSEQGLAVCRFLGALARGEEDAQ